MRKVAVKHVLGKIQPEELKQKLEDDMQLGYYELSKDYQGFYRHAYKIAE